MATRKPDKPTRDSRLPGEADLVHLYRAAGDDGPAPALDARILAEARRAVAVPRVPAHRRWALPLSTAAVMVLAVGVVLFMTREGAVDRTVEREVPSEYALAPATTESRRAAAPADAPLTAKRAAPEPARETVASRPATPTVVEERKKVETAPAAARTDRARTQSAVQGVAAMSEPSASVVAVEASGRSGAYQFNVTVRSPDSGCQQYADWWEVVSEDGELLYRRVLLHSHVDEQPFTRSGGPVPIKADTVVWVRAHMNTSGYGAAAFKGSVNSGFKQAMPDAGFATGLAKQAPLPAGCDF